MKAKYLFLALSAIALATSCSNDEVTEVSDSNAIKFSVSTGKMNRAANIFCNKNYPGSFYVSAKYNPAVETGQPSIPQSYFEGDEVSVESDGTCTTNNGLRYWPNEGSLDFYAYVNAGEVTWSAAEAPKAKFTVETFVTNQKDFLYAVQTNQTKAENSGSNKVQLNFRHALSQIVFQAKNKNQKLHVEIFGVSVCNVNGAGTFTFNSDTDGNYENHIGVLPGEDENTDLAGKGTWELSAATTTTAESNYHATFDMVSLPHTEGTPAVSLTSDNDMLIEDLDKFEGYSNNAMLLIPQEQEEAIAPTTGGFTADTHKDAYFLLKCRIYNVADIKKGYQPTDVCLWGADNEEGKNIAIPVSFNWEQGKKYIYTFVFDENGNGGYDPEDSDPILVPIQYELTVDDFIPVKNEDVDMTIK